MRARAGGTARIRDALGNLGHEIGLNTVKRILLEHGIEPDETAGRSAGPVAYWERVGGMLRYDYRRAA